MGWTYCSTSGLTVQVRMGQGPCCKSSAVGFAVVRIAAMPSAVLMLPLLNTCAIIVFVLVFLHLFPPYSRITEKSIKLPAYFLGHPKLKVTLQFLCPFLAAASTSSGLAAAHSEEALRGTDRVKHREEAAKESLLG